MLCKYVLTIAGISHELPKSCIRNWDEIKRTLKREEFAGVVRTFTSKFEFVGEAYDLLLREWVEKYLKSDAQIAIYGINNRHIYDNLIIDSKLDFGSFDDSGNVISMNTVDNSTATLIKANKGTQYEFYVNDIKDEIPLYYDSIIMKGYSKHTLNTNADVASDELYKLSLGYIKSFTDSKNPETCYRHVFIPAFYMEESEGGLITSRDQLMFGADDIPEWQKVTGNSDLTMMGEGLVNLTDDQYLVKFQKDIKGVSIRSDFFVSGTIKYDNGTEDSGVNPGYHFRHSANARVNLLKGTLAEDGKYRLTNIGSAVLVNGSTGIMNVDVKMDFHEGEVLLMLVCLPWILCTEDRNISRSESVKAEFYTIDEDDNITHDVELCVIEYPFRGEPIFLDVIRPIKVLNELLKSINNGKDGIKGEIVTDNNFNIDRCIILAAESIRGISEAKLYTSYTKFVGWMEAVFGFVPVIDGNIVRFVHRDTLFGSSVIRDFGTDHADFTYSVNEKFIYSSVRIGYEKQDYDNINGRDEFRFTTEFTTGIDITENKLELISPYRADAYGIEFLTRKRGKDTTDNESDNDTFFAGIIRGAVEIGFGSSSALRMVYILDRSDSISGVLSPDSMFNVMYNQRAMLLANSKYIGISADVLKFASSDGNSDVVINNVSLKDDFVIADKLATCGKVGFTTYDEVIPSSVDGIITLVKDDYLYKGYLSEADGQIEKSDGSKYELIVKSISKL